MKKLFITITLLVLLVGSAFAENLIKYGKFKNEKGEYTVLIDIDAREPYDAEKEQLSFFIIDLQKRGFSKVEVHSYKMTENCESWAASISKEHKFYCIVEEYENYDIISHVCDDGTVIEYDCYKNKEGGTKMKNILSIIALLSALAGFVISLINLCNMAIRN